MSQLLKSAEYPETKNATPPQNCPFLDSVDDALSVFGDSAKEAIYYHIKADFGLPREMIPIYPEVFEDHVKTIFLRGAKTILLLVVENVFKRAGLEPSPEAYHLNGLRGVGKRSKLACPYKGKECLVEKCAYFVEAKTE